LVSCARNSDLKEREVDVRQLLRLIVSCAISAAGLVFATSMASAAPTVTWLGSLDAEAGITSAARGVSPDGGTVVGIASSDAPSGYSAFQWTAAGGMTALPSAGEGTATGTTNGGAVISGYTAFTPSDVWGRYWVNGGGGDFIGPVPGGRDGSVFTRGISNDGSIIAGYCFGGSSVGQVALRWTSATGSVALPKLSGSGTYTEAYAISGDGSTIVGTSRDADGKDAAVRWTGVGNSVVSIVGDLPGGAVNGSASGVSPDGSVIVGASSSAASGTTFTEAFRWTQAGGMQPLGLLGGGSSYASDVSADGSVVVGGCGDGAFIWTPSDGMLDLSTHLSNAGVDIGTWSFDSAQAVSDDGRTIVGIGRRAPSFNSEAFVVSIPEPAAAAIACASWWTLPLARTRRRRQTTCAPE
jgi:probable HAF family extracellular repeat protein